MESQGFNMKGPFIGEILSTLPEWTSNDEGREIYVEDEGKRHYGDGTSWINYETLAGSSGSSGSSGTSGIAGTSGSSGSSGTSGIAGTSGSSGTSGIAGTSGSSGTSGIAGTSGSSGTSGIAGVGSVYTNTYSAATSWTVTHNLGSYALIVECWNDTGAASKVLVPNDITQTDNNQLVVDWDITSQAGRVCVVACE